jgi:streptogramin lyase
MWTRAVGSPVTLPVFRATPGDPPRRSPALRQPEDEGTLVTTSRTRPLRIVAALVIALAAGLGGLVTGATAQPLVVTDFPVLTPNSAPTGITTGPDGNLWFTQPGANKIGRITPTGVVTEFFLTTPNGIPTGITSGPDGNLWFTLQGANKIGRITAFIGPMGPVGTVTEFFVITPNSAPTDITTGPDGNLWFTQRDANKIGRIVPAGPLEGTVTEFFVITPNSAPTGITQGPDGNLWFTQKSANKIGRIVPSGLLEGTVTEFNVISPNSGPTDITTGPDGNLWFTQRTANKIGRIVPSGLQEGTVTEFFVITPNSGLEGITKGADGALWFTQNAVSQFGRITPAGTVTEFDAPTVSSGPLGITSGPDNRIWFTEATANRIARVTIRLTVLTVNKVQSGSGTVFSVPAGILCGPTCSAAFPVPTVVVLNAIADAGSVFFGWSGGGCGGTAACVVTVTGNITITATFISTGLMSVDTPAPGAALLPSFLVGGWALDTAATSGTGVDTVHVFAFPNPGSGALPIFLGAATYGIPRPDVGAIFGPQFTNSGFGLTATGLAPGLYRIDVFGRSTVTGGFSIVRSVTVTVSASALMNIDSPVNGAVVMDQPFPLGGWALDRLAPSGTGVDTVHVYAFPNPGSGAPPIFLGEATYGGARPDVGAIFGAQFTNSGFNLPVTGLAPAIYRLDVFARSTVTGTFNNVRSVTITVSVTGVMNIDTPASGAVAVQPFLFGGWALDTAAASGTGVDAVHVYAFPTAGSPTFLGAATYGGARPDIGAVFGAQFTNSGFDLVAAGLTPGAYQLVAFARSTVTGAFTIVRTVNVTVP